MTIGIPFYNCESTLLDAIQSVFAQTYQDWELLLVNDGSTDGSLEIAKSICDPRVKLFSDGQNRRLHYRLNQITTLASQEYIARMDADDVMHPERIEKQIQYLQMHPKVDVVGTAVYTIDDNDTPNGLRGANPPDVSPRGVLAHAILVHPTIMAKAEWFRKNPYDEAFIRAEDYELWCRTYKTSTFASIIEPLYYYRECARAPWKYLRDYLQSIRTVRKILRVYGPASAGWLYTLRLMLDYTAKGEMYRAATIFGQQNTLIKRRNRLLTEEELHSAIQKLEIVFKTAVPGLENTYRG